MDEAAMLAIPGKGTAAYELNTGELFLDQTPVLL